MKSTIIRQNVPPTPPPPIVKIVLELEPGELLSLYRRLKNEGGADAELRASKREIAHGVSPARYMGDRLSSIAKEAGLID